MEQEMCTVIHNSRTCSRYSYVLNESNGIYVADCENAYPTIRQLAYFRNKVKAQRSQSSPTTIQAEVREAGEGLSPYRASRTNATAAEGEERGRAASTESSNNLAISPDAPTLQPKFAEVRVLRGTCAWIAHQLDGEVLAGMWSILPGSPHNIFAFAKISSQRSTSWESNPGQSFYGSHRNRNSTNICDTLHWEALATSVAAT